MMLAEMPSFKLSTRYRLTSINSQGSKWIEEEMHTNEYYSNEQGRARIDIEGLFSERHTPNIRSGRYYHDAMNNQTIKTNLLGSPYCQRASARGVLADLFGRLYDSEPCAKNWLAKFDGVPDHVIGFARLLFIIDANRDKLNEIGSDLVRNRACTLYLLKLNWGSTQRRVEILAYLNQNTSWLDQANMPIRVLFKLSMPQPSSFMIEYSSIEPIQEDHFKGLNYQVDLFTFPIGQSCSIHLGPTNLFQSTRWPEVVSMHANIKDMWLETLLPNSIPKTSKKLFIAYDGYQKAWRQDTIRVNDEAASGGEYMITIHDGNTKRKYNIRQDLTAYHIQGSGTGGGQTLSKYAKNDLASMPTRCVAISTPTQTSYEPLLPFNKLTIMGTAVVRGIKTQVFEHVTKELPALFLEQISFQQNRQQHTYFDQDLQHLNLSLTIVYYLAHTKQGETTNSTALLHLGPLVRVDVMHHYGVIIYRIDLFDFVWELAEAPNGDRHDELFSLRDRCNAGNDNRAESLSQLTMKLDFSNDLQREIFGINEVVRLIQDPLVRNKALARAMIQLGGADIAATKLHEVESRYHVIEATGTTPTYDSKLEILVSAKLSALNDSLFKVTILATAKTLPGARPTGATNFPDCFWEAAHKRAHGQVLFAFFKKSCFIDVQPTINWFRSQGGRPQVTSLISDSSVFKIASGMDSPVDVMKIDIEADKMATNQQTTRWLIYTDLNDEILQVPLINIDKAPKLNLQFRLTRLEVSNNHWSLDGAEEEADVLKGLGLMSGKEVELNDENQSNRQQGQQLDLISCHSACMIDLSCRSYSVCINGQQFSCLTSDLEFRDVKLLADIKSKIRMARIQGIRDSIHVDFKFTPIDNSTTEINENDNDSEDQQSEKHFDLKMDKRCRIYNKRALEMFDPLPKSKTSLKNRTILQVNNEEECAELCLSKNVKYFRKMAKLRLKILTSGQKQVDSEIIKKNLDALREQMINNQRSWCAIFKYLNLATTSIAQDVRKTFKIENTDKGGICLLSKSQIVPKKEIQSSKNETKPGNNKQAAKDPTKFMMDTFTFVYRNLYQMQYGIRMLQLKTVSDNVSNNSQLTDGDVFPLKNEQKVMDGSNVEVCAKSCFTQTIKIAPYCKSFDLIETTETISDGKMRKSKSKTYCVFNSITLAEARNSDRYSELMSTEMVNSGTKVWHFEPRDKYMMDSPLIAILIAKKLNRVEYNSELASSFGLVLIWLAAIVSGIILGTYLKEPITRRWTNLQVLADSSARNLINNRKFSRENEDLDAGL